VDERRWIRCFHDTVRADFVDRLKVIVITGPTATGKSVLGVRLAERLEGEIVSADSMQIYKHMDIGTAKPTSVEMRGIRHHMIDIIPPSEDYSVARYVEDAAICVDDIFRRNKQPILVGGTGLYIDSLIAGRTFSVRGNENLRQTLEDEFDEIGGEAMLLKLREVDAPCAARLHANDKKRIVRALEALETTGKPLSQHDAESKTTPPRYDAVKFALTFANREVLYARIEHRVDEMLTKGLINEVSSLLDMIIPRSSTSMQAIGYKEIADAIVSGSDIGEAVDKVKMESRRYAKRQLTWQKRDIELTWITWDDAPDIDRGMAKITGKESLKTK